MGKTSKARNLFILGIIGFTVLFTTCKNSVGLGGTVDINPPTVNAKTMYPPVGSVIKGSFILSVEAQDDTEIVSIAVSITPDTDAANPGQKLPTDQGFFNLKKAADGLHWQAELNTQDAKKNYPIKDGSYQAEFLAKDSAGKEVRAVTTFTIDNTPPLLVLDRPSTAAVNPSAAYKDGDTFGDGFWLIGQSYDRSAIAKLEITAEPVGGGKGYTQTIKNVPANIRLKVDSFSDDKEKKNFYCGLYGTNQKDGKQNFRYSLKITDDAREYKNPSNTAGSGEGNTSTIFYLKDDIDQKVMRNRRLQDVYAVLYGKTPASISENDAKVIKNELAASANQIGGGGRTGVFALNPSLNPTFETVGRSPVKQNENGTLASEFAYLYEGSSLQIRLSRNLDDDSLTGIDPAADPGTDSYQFFLAEWAKYKTDYSGSSFDINNDESIYENSAAKQLKPGLIQISRSTVERDGGNYVFTIPVHKSEALAYDKPYVLLVRGKDTAGHELIAAADEKEANVYGIRLRSTNQPPEVSVININGTKGNTEGTANITERVFIKKGNSVPFTIKLDKEADITYELAGTPGLPKTDPPIRFPKDFSTITIPASAFNQTSGGNYQLKVKASANGSSSLEQIYHIAYDVKGPEIVITSPVAGEKRNDKKIVISGTVFDAGAGLALDTATPPAKKPLMVKLSKIDGEGLFTNRELQAPVTGDTWNTSEIDLSDTVSSNKYGEGTYSFTVTATDALGQVSTTEPRTFIYDTKAPEITELKVNGQSITNGGTVYTNKTPVKIEGKVTESYGIKTFTIDGKSDGLPATNAAAPTKSFDKEFSLAEGEYPNVKIVLIDKADKSAQNIQFNIVVDKTAPVFENIKFGANNASSTLITTSGNPIKVSGTIKDSAPGITVSGIKEVQYAVTEKTVTTAPSTGWQQLSGTLADKDYTLNGFIPVPTGEERKIWITAIDNAGNKTTPVLSQSVKVVAAAVIQWKLDLLNGASEHDTAKQKAGTWYTKGKFKVKIGGALDPVPVDDTIFVKIEKDGTTVAPGDFFTLWNENDLKILADDTPKEYTVKPDIGDGTYTITLKANNQAHEQVFTVDKTKPDIELNTSGEEVLPADGNWVNTTTLRASGTAADATSGIETIESIVTGSVPSSKKTTVLGTASPWSGYLTLHEGRNTVQFKATDKAENANSTTERTIYVDTNQPTITFTDGKTTGHVNKAANGTFTVQVTVEDKKPASAPDGTVVSGLQEVQYSTNASFPLTPATATMSKPVTANSTVSIQLSGLTAATTYYFRAVDKAGNTSALQPLNLFVDAQEPEISFDEYTPRIEKGGNTYTNKTVHIHGIARDNDTVKKVLITAAGTKTDGTSVMDQQIQEFTDAATSSWSFDFDSTEYKDNTDVLLSATAEDNSGNKKTATLTLKIKQDTDNPRVRIEKVNTPASGDTNNPTVLVQKTVLEGTVLDDDGTVKKIEIAKDANFTDGKKEFTTTTSPVSVPHWKYEGLPADGNVQLYFRITDAKENTFTSSATSPDTRPVLYTVNEQGVESTVEKREPLALRTDSTRPSIAVQYIKVLPVGEATLQTLSGVQHRKSTDALTLEVPVYDSSGIKSLTATVEGKPPISAKNDTNISSNVEVNGKQHAFWAFSAAGGNTIPLTSLQSGNYVLKLEATDKNGLTASTNIIVTVDDALPTVSFSTYKDPIVQEITDSTSIVKKQLGGKIILTGEFSDGASGSGIDKATVQVSIGRDTKLKLGTGGTSPAVGGVTAETNGARWELTFENICELGAGENYKDYANKDDDGHFIKYDKNNSKLGFNSSSTSAYAKSKIYEVPLTVTVSDRAGNTKKQIYLLLVDSDGAAPNVKVTAPQHTQTTETGKNYLGYSVPTMGNSTIVFSGTAQPKIIAGTNKVTTIQVRFSEQEDFSKSFNSEPAAKLPGQTTIAAVEWKDGVTVLKDTNRNFDTWTFQISGSNFLQAPPLQIGQTSRELYYQIRGLYENASGETLSEGEWSETRKLIINQTAPSFSDSYINIPSNDYEVNKSVKTGDIVYIKAMCETDIESIELSSVTKSLEADGKPAALNKTYTKTQLETLAPDSTAGTQQTNKWTRHIESGPLAQKGYLMPIELDVSQLNDPNETLILNVKLITKKDDKLIDNTQVFVFTYDKYKPQVVFGTVVGTFGKGMFGATEVIVPKEGLPSSADNLYIFVRDNDENERSAHKIKVTKIEPISGSDTAKLSYSLPTGLPHSKLAGECLYVLFKQNQAAFNRNGPYQIQGIAHDRGTGVDKGKVIARVYKAGITPSDSTPTNDYKEVTMTRDDGTNKITGEAGTFVTFKGAVDVSTLGDGAAQLWITAYDGADNASDTAKESIHLRNNPIAVVKMHFQTDLDKDGAYTTPGESYAVAGDPKVETEGAVGNEKNTFKNLYDAGFVYRQKDVNTTKSFTFKNRTNSALKVEFVGGAGVGQTTSSTYSYKLYKEKADDAHLVMDGENTSVTQASVTHAATEDNLKANSSGFASLDIPLKGKFGTGDKLLNEGETDLILRVTDTVTGDDERYAEVKMKVAAKLTDGRLPQAVMLPFYWNGTNDNSLKENSPKNGHIEIATTKPSVSGAVVLRGFTYHPSFVQRIKLSGAGINAHITYKNVEQNGKWKGDTSATAGFTATTTHLSKEGHWVQWEYVWDTPTPASDQTIMVQAESIAETAAFDVQGTQNAATGITVKAGAAEHIAAAVGQNISFIKEDGSVIGTPQTITSVTASGSNKTITWSGSIDLTNAKIAQIHLVSPNTALTPTSWHHIAVNSATAANGTLPANTKVTAGQFIKLTDAVISSTPPQQVDGEQLYLVSATADGSGGQTPWKPSVSTVPVNTTVSRAYLYPIDYGTDLQPVYNNPKLTVDVVPYITGLTTELSKLGSTSPDLYARTALGRYPVKDGETIKIGGFNLTGAKCTVVSPTEGSSTEANIAGTTSPWSLKLPADAKSGKLTATVGTVEAINNSNDNTKEYNQAAKMANNDKLTDDAYLDVWQFNSTAAQPVRGVITEPVMHINPSSGMIGFAFANGPEYFSMSNGNTNSYQTWHQNYDDFGNVDFVYDSSGIAHGVVTGRDINSSANHAGKFTYLNSKWGPASPINDGNNYGGANALRLEAIGQKGTMNSSSNFILDKTRIQHPSLAVADVASNGDTRLYLAYYDSLNDQIRFKAGILQSSQATKTNFDQFTDQETGNKVTAYNQDNVSIIAGKYTPNKDTNNKTGTYLSLGVVSGTDAGGDVAVLIWFDEASRKLKYTYKKKPQDPHHAGSGSGDEHWAVPKDVFAESNIGEYCKIAVDKNGGIHIAAYNIDTASLHYAYLSSYTATSFQTCVVDSHGITGRDIRLDVALSATGNPIPYIGYYSASAGRAKLAYLVDKASGFDQGAAGVKDGYFTGNWEISCIPTTSRIMQEYNNINVGVWKDATGKITASSTAGSNSSNTTSGTVYGNGTVNPVLGYAIKASSINGYIETAQKK